jgi:exo-1,4-beta-D-glucosaminidase
MLRSEGFSIRETDEFYDLCDRYGIMVTQQIFGRSIPEEDLAVRLIEDTILRIRNHPSLVHFLGHDETFPTPTLDRAYRELIARYTPERTYQPHSGAFDVRERFETGGTRTGTRELWTYANASHYYTHKEDGAWGFAQSGGIGGIVSPIESLRKMMPEKDLWPPTSEAFSFHTVTQGIRYFDAFREALDRRYGPATDIVDFALKAQAMNYESARGMFEAYGRNKYSATGITTWKYNAAWPAALTWQYIDWNLYAGGAYYGAQKACEPLHVQYAYDDQAVYVVNSYYRDMQNLRVTARIFDFHMVERLSEVAVVDVAADDKTKAFVIKRPEGLTGTYFLSLDLANASGKTVSDNLYWLSTIPEIEGTKGYTEDRIFYVRPRSHPDHTDLTTLPKVKIHSSHAFRKGGDEQVGFVTVENPTNHLAFLIQLAVTKGEGGEEVRPSYWSNNYFCVLPGGRKEVEVTFREQDLEGKRAALRVTGWTVE